MKGFYVFFLLPASYFENDKKVDKENKAENKLEKLQEDLKVAIKEERYEDAAKIRDEIKKMSK